MQASNASKRSRVAASSTSTARRSRSWRPGRRDARAVTRLTRPGRREPIHLVLEDALARRSSTQLRASADHPLNRSGLEAALARPGDVAHYKHADLAMQAAMLAHGVAEGQFFVDGNKRLALVAIMTFLELNGYRVEASDPELAQWILDLAAGTTPEQLAERIRAALSAILA